jgi:outer membrane protein TolC
MRFFSLWAPVLLLLNIGAGIAANADAAELTLSRAQRLAVERSQQLVAQDASITSSREMAVAAGQLPDPMLRLGADNLPVEGPDRFSVSRDFMTMRRIGVMQEFTRAEKRQLRSARLEREADRAIAEKNAALAAIQRDTAIAWLETYYLERLRSAVAQQAGEIRREIQAAESAYRGGRASQADVLTAETSRVMLDDRLSELDRRIRTARAVLARWIGATARLLLLDDPTAGVDVATRPELHRRVTELRDAGAAVLLVSTDVEELVDLCDRVLTFDRGSVTGELAAAELTPARVLEAMTKGAT